MATQIQTQIELNTLNQNPDRESVTSSTGPLDESILATPGNPEPFIVAQNDGQIAQFLPKGRSIITIIQLSGVNFITSYNTGLVTVALPAMSKSLDIHPSLLLWPVSVYTLTMATCLLPAGAMADVVGARVANLAGCFFIAVFILLSGVSQTGIQLIMFRAMQGIAGAFAIPSSLSIISKSIESGKRRNIGFSCLGLAQPLGFSIGLVLGGVFVSGLGWQVGEYLGGAVGFLLFAIGIWAVPPDAKVHTGVSMWKRLATEVDWLGACIASISIALLSYVLA
jgi:MFS family permease